MDDSLVSGSESNVPRISLAAMVDFDTSISGVSFAQRAYLGQSRRPDQLHVSLMSLILNANLHQSIYHSTYTHSPASP
jgi:hypothetical protein